MKEERRWQEEDYRRCREVGRTFRSLSDRNASIYTSANAPPQDGSNWLIYVSNYRERLQFITSFVWNPREMNTNSIAI